MPVRQACTARFEHLPVRSKAPKKLQRPLCVSSVVRNKAPRGPLPRPAADRPEAGRVAAGRQRQRCVEASTITI